MSNTRVWEMIKKKKAYRKRQKKDSALRRGPNLIIKEFIIATEDLRQKVPSVEAFYMEFGTLTSILEKEMMLIDPDVDLRIMWICEHEAEVLEDLRVDGVEIKWSKFYKRKHPFTEDAKIVDFAYLWMNGYFD